MITPMATALAVALFLAGCGGGGTADVDPADNAGASGARVEGVPRETGLIGVTEPDSEPQQGGTLTVASWAEVRTLDSKESAVAGVLGGMEVSAIYDVLIRYNPVTGEFEPWMAKSLTHSDDFATWTLTLREGVMFSDGTPVNAEAVAFNVKRDKNGRRYSSPLSQIASMETPDDHTVIFHLKEPWSRFPYLLSATGAGRLASPTAVKRWGEEYPSHPVGAGPFVLDHFNPREELVLTANENYWGEGPYLDTLRFVPLGGDEARLDTLKAGGVQIAFLRDASVIVDALKAGYSGFVNVTSAGEVLAINNAEGQPGSDLRVRKAVAYAINIEQFNQRVYDGKGLAQKEVMAETSRWATETEATPYDPGKAKELLAEAKSDGFDGELTLLSNSTPTRKAEALALQAQLNAVGFEVSVQYEPSIGALYEKLQAGTFELAMYGIGILDVAPWDDLQEIASDTEGSVNYMRYSNPEMDTLINDLHDATTAEGRQGILNDIQELWAETVPFVPLAAIPSFTVWNDDSVHGGVPTANSTVLFSQAWTS